MKNYKMSIMEEDKILPSFLDEDLMAELEAECPNNESDDDEWWDYLEGLDEDWES